MPSWQALRTTEDWAKCRHIFRFEACLVRARSRLNSIYCLGVREVCLSFRIDESCKIKDMRVLAKMLEDGELKHTPASGNSLFKLVFFSQPSKRCGRLSIMTQRSSRPTRAVSSIKGLQCFCYRVPVSTVN